MNPFFIFDIYTFTLIKKLKIMNKTNVEINRQSVNDSIGRLPNMGNTRRTVWFNKRRFSNI